MTETGVLFTNGTPSRSPRGTSRPGRASRPRSSRRSPASTPVGWPPWPRAGCGAWKATSAGRGSRSSPMRTTSSSASAISISRRASVIDSPSTFPDGDVISVSDSVRTRNAFYGGAGRLQWPDRRLRAGPRPRALRQGCGRRRRPAGRAGRVEHLHRRGRGRHRSGRSLRSRVERRDLHPHPDRLPAGPRCEVHLQFHVVGPGVVRVLADLPLQRDPSGQRDRPGGQRQHIRFVAEPTPSNLDRPAFSCAEELVVQGMTFGFRVQY